MTTQPATASADAVREEVRSHYAAMAQAISARCASTCCGPTEPAADPFGAALYDTTDRDAVPGAAMAASLGCGNPTAVASRGTGRQ